MTFALIRNAFLAVALLSLASCTSSSVDQSIAPQPIASSNPDISTSATTVAASGDATQQSSAIGYATTDLGQNNSEAANQVAALNLGKSVTFLPIEGAPQTAASTFSRSLSARAQIHGLSILPSQKSGAKYRVKGYFSALNDGTGTLLVYIWDVIDAQGKRVHRINGRERAGGVSINPWQSITDKEISAMADSTAARLKAWVDAQA